MLVRARALKEKQHLQPQSQPQIQSQLPKTQTVYLSALQFCHSKVLFVLESKVWNYLQTNASVLAAITIWISGGGRIRSQILTRF